MTNKYNVGDKIPLSEIVPGDEIRFETKYERHQTDTVELIIDLYDNLRTRAFCDSRKQVINHFPDTVTDAYLVALSPDRAKAAEEEAFRAKYDKGLKNFRNLKKGSVFAINPSTGCWMIYTKLKGNQWSVVETLADGSGARLEVLDDIEAFEVLYDPTSGNCYGLMQEENTAL